MTNTNDLNYTINPKTKRAIKILGPTHLKILKAKTKKSELKQTITNYKNLIELNKGDVSRMAQLSAAKFKFDKKTINNLLVNVYKKPMKMVIYFKDSPYPQYITLAGDSKLKKNIQDWITNYARMSYNQTHAVGSDILGDIDIDEIESIDFIANSDFGKGKTNKAGHYFKYINTSKIDLTKYQILNENDNSDILNNNCLIYAFEKLNIEASLINRVKLAVGLGVYIAKNQFEKICDIIQKKIILHSFKIAEDKEGIEDSARTETKQRTETHGASFKDEIHLAIYKDHYFVHEPTIYNIFSIKNYNKCANFNNLGDVYKIQHNKPNYKTTTKCDSMQLIRYLMEQNQFTDKHHILINRAEQGDLGADNIILDHIEDDQIEDILKVKEKAEHTIFFGDCETMTNSTTNENHELFLLGVVKLEAEKSEEAEEIEEAEESEESEESEEAAEIDKVKIFSIIRDKEYIVKNFLDYLCKNSKTSNITCYFHNLKYDYHVLIKYLTVRKNCSKDGNLYYSEISHIYKETKFKIILADSYKLINIGLAKFNKTFKLPEELNKKEAINYDFYNKESIQTTKHSKKEYCKNFSEEHKQIFEDTLKVLKSTDEEYFNAIEYYEYYLKYDCIVLKEGLKVLRTSFLKIGELDIFNSTTISSYSNLYFKTNKSFEGIFKCKGNLREYYSLAIRGGRVSVLESEKKRVINKNIVDYDAVSLYPTAIYRICQEFGFPKGKAKQLLNHMLNLNSLNKTDYYVVTINITNIRKKQQIPFISAKNKEGILQYLNEVPEGGLKCVVDKITLEDYIKFHDIEYEIIEGVYYNEGFNKTMGYYILKLFDQRKIYKTNKEDILQELIKLVLNSSYGKTITKKSNTETIFKKVGAQTNNYIVSNFHTIKESQQINERQIQITKLKVDEDYNLGIIGLMILSMSKRVMNEVMSIANDNNIKIYYQDTDSMHIEKNDIAKLEYLYKMEYKKELHGSDLGNFHTDFKLKGAVTEISSKRSIFLDKKSYIDHLIAKNKDGQDIEGYHIRLKGITEDGINKAIKDYGNGDPFKLFERLANGEEVEFILNPAGARPKFAYNKNGVFTRKANSFKRILNKQIIEE